MLQAHAWRRLLEKDAYRCEKCEVEVGGKLLRSLTHCSKES